MAYFSSIKNIFKPYVTYLSVFYYFVLLFWFIEHMSIFLKDLWQFLFSIYLTKDIWISI